MRELEASSPRSPELYARRQMGSCKPATPEVQHHSPKAERADRSQRHVQTGESCVYRNRSSGCGIRMALIQFAADCNETKCKSCGQVARIFCTYFQRAGCNSELTPCESRSLNCPGPCPPAPHAASLHRQRGPLSVAKGNGVGASVLKQEMSARALGWFWLKIRRPKSAPLGCASRH